MDVFESVKELTVCGEHPDYSVWVALIVTFLRLRQPVICVLLHA